MSMYIKGMEMPTHCMDCPFMISRDNDDCILQSDEANEGFENWEQMKGGCPLVPVPPHGRLGDLDELSKRIKEEGRNQAEFYANRYHPVVLAYGDCYGKVKDAPTIILASEEGK